MSGIFGSTTIKGTRITDFSSTSAEVGKAIPFGHGSYPVDGFIGWAPLPPTEHRQVKRQGKGGVKQETFTYTLPYAVMFCKGPTFGWRWIKRNGKVVYTTDPNAPLEDKAYAEKWAQRVNFYNGSLDQLPDSLIESHEGVGNVSAFHGMTYFTVEDEDVTDTGGAPPNYEGVVIATPPEAYLTSKVYPQFFSAQATLGASLGQVLIQDILKDATFDDDSALDAFSFDGGGMVVPLGPNHFDNLLDSISLTGGELKVPPNGNQKPDNLLDSISLTGGELKVP